jgi:hypothetical protein
VRLPHPLTGEALEKLRKELEAAPPPVELPEIPVTLRAGVDHNVGRIRVRVVEHVWKQKPRFKLLGPAVYPPKFKYPERRRRRRAVAA